MQTHESYQPSYNPAFLARVREKRRLARIEAAKKAATERVLREREDRACREREIDEQKAEAENAKAAERNRVIECIGRKDRLGVKDVIRLVAAEHGLTYEDIVGPCRRREIITARFEAIHRVRKARPEMSVPQLGRFFNRDHTTILNALQRHEERMSATHISRKAA